MAREGDAYTTVTVHLAAVQQVTRVRLLSVTVQVGCGAPLAEEARIGRRRDEKLQTCVESSVFVQAAGESRPDSTSALSRQQRLDAKITLCLWTVSQH